MKVAAHALFFISLLGFGDSAVTIRSSNQVCKCHPASFPSLSVDSIFFPNGFRWESCSYSDEYSSCSGSLISNSSCQVSYNSNEGAENFFIDCNNGACITSINYYNYELVCQEPLGCLL